MEEESDEFHERVIRGYRELAENNRNARPNRWAESLRNTIENQIWNALARTLPDLENIKLSKSKLQKPECFLCRRRAGRILGSAHTKKTGLPCLPYFMSPAREGNRMLPRAASPRP